MPNLAATRTLLIADEGLRLKPYRCPAGKLTIGVGRNLTDKGISKAEAYIMLQNDMDEVEDALDRILPWWRGLSEGRQQALLNMCFNLGINGLLGFRRMLAALQGGDYMAAADEMLASKWAAQVGDRAQRIAKMTREG